MYLSKLLGDRVAGCSKEGSQSSARQVSILVAPALVRVVGVFSSVVGDRKAVCTLGVGETGREVLGGRPPCSQERCKEETGLL